MAYIKAAEAIGVDTIVFPELTLMGYPIHDTIDRHPVIVDENVKWVQRNRQTNRQTKVMIGFVEQEISIKSVKIIIIQLLYWAKVKFLHYKKITSSNLRRI